MNIYHNLNQITKYIDDNLDEPIAYGTLAKLLGTNIYTMQRLFSALSGLSLSEYIRKRRLSDAGFYLCQHNFRIIDLAIKYQYTSAAAFSRAFAKFHGINPSQIGPSTPLKNFPRIIFDETIKLTTALNYEIVTLNKFDLYGVGIPTTNLTIENDAPLFFEQTEKKYGTVNYGMITYTNPSRFNVKNYYCLYNKKIPDFEHLTIPKSKWLKFTINSQNPSDIQALSQKFYKEFLPSCKYNLKKMPELEYYHDYITDFLVAIS